MTRIRRHLPSPGPLTFTGECSADEVRVVATTTEAHSAAVFLGIMLNEDGDLNPGERLAAAVSRSPTVPRIGTTQFSATSPSGTRMNGVLNGGGNVHGRSAQCVFGGFAVIG